MTHVPPQLPICCAGLRLRRTELRDRIAEIRTLYAREVRSALRERNIVINSIVLPILLYPALLWLGYSGVSFVTGQSENLRVRVVLIDLPSEHAAFRTFLNDQTSVEIHSLDSPEDSLRSGSVDVAVEFNQAADAGATGLTNLVDDYRVRLLYDGSRDRSLTARSRMDAYLSDYRQRYLLERVRAAGIREATIQQVWIEQQNLATGNEMGRFILGLLVPLLMVIMLVVGGIYPAIDSTAGERENGTWETLMTVSSRRSSIVIAKYLYVTTMSFIAGMLNVIAISITLRAILVPLVGEDASDLSVRLPIATIGVMFVGAALMALFVSAAMMILASFARTFREGQSMVGPFYIAILIPVMFLQVPDLHLTPGLALVPVVNVTLMFRDAITGVYQWHLIGITMVIEFVTIAIALALANAILSHEDFLMGSHAGNFGRFCKSGLLGRFANS